MVSFVGKSKTGWQVEASGIYSTRPEAQRQKEPIAVQRTFPRNSLNRITHTHSEAEVVPLWSGKEALSAYATTLSQLGRANRQVKCTPRVSLQESKEKGHKIINMPYCVSASAAVADVSIAVATTRPMSL